MKKKTPQPQQYGSMQLTPYRSLVSGRDGIFVVNPKDFYVGGALLRYGEFSHLEMDTFDKFLKNPDILFVEIGANIGAHTVGLAKKVRRLIAFEPQPQVFFNLCANVFLNNLTNVDCFMVGLGKEESTLYLPDINYNIDGNFGGITLQSEGKHKVPVHTLDSYELAPKFIKIDVEGMEEEVLRGSVETLKKYRPVLYVENDRIPKSKSLIEYLWSLDYTLYWDRPTLFNVNNIFGNPEDYAPHVVSVNMICIPNNILENEYNLPGKVIQSEKHPFE